MADELIIKEVELLRLRPGDILVVDIGTTDPDAVEQVADAINSALTHVGLQDNVTALLHEGTVKLQLIRAEPE